MALQNNKIKAIAHMSVVINGGGIPGDYFGFFALVMVCPYMAIPLFGHQA